MEEGIKLNENLSFDIDAIKRFIFEEDYNDGKYESEEVTESHGLDKKGNLVVTDKVVHKVKTSDFSDKQTIRYDLLKMFVDMLDGVEIENDIAPMSFGQRTVLNTMINYGLIKEINE